MAASTPASENFHNLAKTLRRCSWIGFWGQLGLGAIPVGLFLSTRLLTSASAPSTGFDLKGVLIVICLIGLLFTIYWSFRYAQIGRSLTNPDRRPAKSGILRSIWIGILLNIVVMLLAIVICMSIIGTLLMVMLMTPQGATIIYDNASAGIPIGPRVAISAMDLINLQAGVNTITAGLIGVITSLILLRRLD